jgi:hypothetical protein
VASDAIEDYYLPDDRPGLQRSFVPVRRGERFLASFNGSRAEPLPTAQLELPFSTKGHSSSRPPNPGEVSEQLDTGWTLITPDENRKGAGEDERRSAESTTCTERDGERTAHFVAPRRDSAVPAIRAPRMSRVADTPPSDTTFSIRRFLIGCAAGLATAAMILMTIRLAVG